MRLLPEKSVQTATLLLSMEYDMYKARQRRSRTIHKVGSNLHQVEMMWSFADELEQYCCSIVTTQVPRSINYRNDVNLRVSWEGLHNPLPYLVTNTCGVPPLIPISLGFACKQRQCWAICDCTRLLISHSRCRNTQQRSCKQVKLTDHISHTVRRDMLLIYVPTVPSVLKSRQIFIVHVRNISLSVSLFTITECIKGGRKECIGIW